MKPQKTQKPIIPKGARLLHETVAKVLKTFFWVAKSNVRYSLRQWIMISKKESKRPE